MSRVTKREDVKFSISTYSNTNLYPPPQNFSIMSEYMTSMGRIKHISETGLRPVNQRKMAKAIRRAIGIGLIPSTHAHPEMFDRRFLR
jgi:small subunit ribosomal protein S18